MLHANRFRHFSKALDPILNFNIDTLFGKLQAFADDHYIEINEANPVTIRDAKGQILQGRDIELLELFVGRLSRLDYN